jgi:hypothetical protein
MSWGAQNRSKDAKTPSAGRGMSDKPEPGLWPVQPYTATCMDDPSGDIGVYIRYESRNNYEDRCDEYDDKRTRGFGLSSWGL